MKEDKCAKCGACTAVCPIYRITGKESLTARGKLHLIKHLPQTGTRNLGHILSKCLLCGACRQICPRKLDPPELISQARGRLSAGHRSSTISRKLAETAFSSSQILAGTGRICENLIKYLPATSGLWLRFGLNPPPEPARSLNNNHQHPGKEDELNYFPGCLATYLQPEIARATTNLGHLASGTKPWQPEEQTCCGLAAASCGNQKAARKLARENIAAFADNDRPILTSCASCYSFLKNYQTLLAHDPEWANKAENFSKRIREFSSYFLPSFTATATATASRANPPYYHDPCHLRLNPDKITAEPRQLIRAITGTPPRELPNGQTCCGNGGLFRLSHPQLASKIADQTLELLGLEENLLLTSCSGCLLQWRQNIARRHMAARVKHLAIFISEIIQKQSPA